ncbi:hypothetical protein [Ostreiculturibacter nitratireducens]|uniref:hypothetical protein n=1 Tax=Ostreiculturibacter nitratireducens TaxID=3075226 RepID=UPI0031B5A69B
MIQFPSAEAEIAGLTRFLSDSEGPADLRARAERLVLKLSHPVRVAFLGPPSSGKTELAGFLVGEKLSLPDANSGHRPPLILSYAETPSARAGWWDGKELAVPPRDLGVAYRARPDFVELRLPNPILKLINFIDMPGLDKLQWQAEQVRWTAARAEVLIWCTHAAWAWNAEEDQLWSLVPPKLQKSSLLAVTHTDVTLAVITLDKTLERLRSIALPKFREMVTMATPAAAAAAPGGSVQDVAAWDAAGGRAMVGKLLAAARAVREADIETARAFLAEVAIQPSEVSELEPGLETASPPASAAAVLRDDLQRRLDDLVALASEDGEFRMEAFLTRSAELAEALGEDLSAPGALTEEGAWVRDEMKAAAAELGHLLEKGGMAACLDAAGIILQLGRDLGWALPHLEEG